MTTNGSPGRDDLGQVPSDNRDELAADGTRTREGDISEATDAKADVKARAKTKATQAKQAVTERFGEQAEHAVQAAQAARGKVLRAKEKISGLGSPSPDTVPSPEAPPVVRRSAAAATGLAVVVTVWVWRRRRARRKANMWQAAARDAKAQIKTVRRQAKSGLKTARKRAQRRAAAQVAAAKSRAQNAKARAKSSG